MEQISKLLSGITGEYRKMVFIAILSLALIVGGFFGYLYWQRFAVIFELRVQLQEIREKRARLVRENADLRQRLTLRNNLDYIEQLAREKLGLVKAGEQ